MKRGFSLAELTVAIFLLATVLGLVVGVLFPSLFMFRAESARGDAQQAAMILTTKLQRALLNTSLEWVTVSNLPVAVAYREVDPANPYDAASGAANFQRLFQIIRYDGGLKKVYQRPWPPGPPDPTSPSLEQPYDFNHVNMSKLTPGDLATICHAPSSRERTLADHVESLILTDQDENLTQLSPPLKIVATCTVDNFSEGRKSTERYQLEVSVSPRCQRW
ncbi:MAG: type II secretion system protein [Vulcanimicrobiota bacterium]